MKTLKLITLLTFVLLVAVAPGFAQSQPTKTTLSSAMVAGQTTAVVASATGAAGNWVLIEKDLRRVLSVSGTTLTLTSQSGNAVAHPSGSNVIVGAMGNWNTNGTSTGTFLSTIPTGTCTRANQVILPKFIVQPNNANPSATADCLNGKWAIGTPLDQPGMGSLITGPCNVPVGSVAYGSFGTDTTTSATGQLTTSLFVPYTMIMTGLTNLNGSAVNGASKKIFILSDQGGALLANSATAGTLASGNDAFQAIAFTATKVVIGPALYYASLQDDTADVAGVRTVAASTFKNIAASSLTSVFGTVGAITPPTTFTADTGPVICAY